MSPRPLTAEEAVTYLHREVLEAVRWQEVFRRRGMELDVQYWVGWASAANQVIRLLTQPLMDDEQVREFLTAPPALDKELVRDLLTDEEWKAL